MSDCMSKEGYIERITDCRNTLRKIADSKCLGDGTQETWACGISSNLLNDLLHEIEKISIPLPSTGIGDVSDGYHTFNELYYHRAVLFSVICNQNKDKAWKSKSHHDGTMYENMFIVGIDTPEGQATYHYDVNPYWDIFHVKTLDNAPVWDGHTPEQAINRILTLAK